MLTPDQVVALRDGTIDLALLRPHVDQHLSADMTWELLRRDRYVLALPDDHRLATRRRLKLSDLRDESLVVHSGRGRSAMHGTVVELCHKAGFEPTIRHEVAETSTLVTFVAAGLGVAVVPEPVARLGVPGVTYLPLAIPDRMDLLAVTRAHDDSAALQRSLIVLRRQVVV